MKKGYSIFQKNWGTSPYMWSVFSILPFYFVFQSSGTVAKVIGITLTIVFFISYRFAFISKKWPVYLWTTILIGISVTMTILFQFIYFSFYIAYYNGNIKSRIAFITLYVIHLVSTIISINYNVVLQKNELFLTQLPFIIIILISVILLPFNIYNKKKQEALEEQLQDANERIAELVKHEERQRIARDLHDTLGQKLSLIGLKSDLARKLIYKDPEQAQSELKDVQQTARTALNEVRKMVSQMRGVRLSEEIIHVTEILKAAEIDFISEEWTLANVSLYLENILSMCVKESVNNIVKHSQASTCQIKIEQSWGEICVTVQDNGIGITDEQNRGKGSGIFGMKERLEFVNGSLDIINDNGTIIIMSIPNVIKRTEKGELL